MTELIREPKYLMENGEIILDGRLVSKELHSSIFSYLTFSWVNPLLTLGQSKPLEEEDLPHLTESDKMSIVIQKWNSFRTNTDGIIW